MTKKYLKLLLESVTAGATIGMGATVFLRVKDMFPGGAVPGAFLFSIGLIIICTRGYALFTGKCCYLFDNKPSYILDLIIIWFGNLIGCMIIAFLEKVSVICGPEGIDAAATALVQAKMQSSPFSLFCLGIICNIFIFVGVNAYAKNPHEIGKYLTIMMGVAGFILAGTEHCIADQFYWALSGVLYETPAKSFICLLIISLGNVVGGTAFPLAEKAMKKLAV